MRTSLPLHLIAALVLLRCKRRRPRAKRRRFLPRQAGQPDRRRLDRRRLRHLRPHGRAASRRAHPRQADGGGAEHAGGGRARRRQPHLSTSRPRTAPSSRCSRTPCRSSRSSRTSRRSSTPRKFGWLGTPTDRGRALHVLAHVEDQDAQGRADAGIRRGRRRRGLDAGVLRPRVQPALQLQGALHRRLSRPERDPACDGGRRGRGHGVAVLVDR